MIKLPRQFTKETTGKATRMVALSMACLFIAACSSGDGVQIGTGQDPDPVVIDFPIAYIKAPIPVDDNGEFQQQDLREQITFEFGADLYFRDRASPSAEAINITEDVCSRTCGHSRRRNRLRRQPPAVLDARTVRPEPR